jgi:hypothetical protein
MKTPYELALEEAAKECGFNSKEEINPFQSKYPYTKVHQRAAEIYAMKAMEWVDDNSYTQTRNRTWLTYKERHVELTTQQLLEMFNKIEG